MDLMQRDLCMKYFENGDSENRKKENRDVDQGVYKTEILKSKAF